MGGWDYSDFATFFEDTTKYRNSVSQLVKTSSAGFSSEYLDPYRFPQPSLADDSEEPVKRPHHSRNVAYVMGTGSGENPVNEESSTDDVTQLLRCFSLH